MSSKHLASLDMNVFSKAQELKKRIFFTIIALIVCRIGSYIPVPGINSNILAEISAQNNAGILGMFNMLSGGSLGRMSIFALAIVPYITASIIIQLLSVISKNIEALKKEGETGRKKIAQLTRYLTVLLTAIQGFGLAAGLESMNVNGNMLVINPGWFFKLTTTVSLVSGTITLMWLGEQITARGVGNGTSLIIFTGIVAGIPSALAKTFELGRSGAISILTILIILVLIIFIIYLVVFIERAQRKILIQYPKRQVGNKLYGGENTHLPLKINTAGVIPPIFAGAILSFPSTIANFNSKSMPEWFNKLSLMLSHGTPLFIVLYIGLIVIFSFYYTAIVFNPEETAENLKKHGGFIPGRRPGKNTSEYLDFIITRLTVIGAIYISFICAFPEVLMNKLSIPFYLGGTSILIVVNVVIDTVTQVQTHLFAHQYEGLIKKVKLRDKKA